MEKMTARSLSVAIVVSLLAIPTVSYSWGWGTHAYFANHFGALIGAKNQQETYGAILPDVDEFMGSYSELATMFYLTHYSYPLFVQEAGNILPRVGTGFCSHNEEGMADYTAHVRNLTLDRLDHRGYVVIKAERLMSRKAGAFGSLRLLFPPEFQSIASEIAEVVAHSAIEEAVDLWLKRKQDPLWPVRLYLSSSFRDPRIPEILVAAYGPYLPADDIRNAEALFREAAVGYAALFLLPEPTVIEAMVQAGAQQLAGYVLILSGGQFTLDPDDPNLQALLGEILAGAIDEVRPDYIHEVQATNWRIRQRIGQCR